MKETTTASMVSENAPFPQSPTVSRDPARDRWFLIAIGLVQLICTGLAARFVDRDSGFVIYSRFYFAMSIPWLAAVYYVHQHAAFHRTNRAWIFWFALAMRAAFFVTDPVLSDDIYRYVWDGRVQHAGINPYLYAPDAEELAFLRDAQYEGINNKDIPTIYPPLMEASFALITWFSTNLLWMKACFVAADVALIIVMFHLLGTMGLNPARAIVYAWCPLVIVEVAGSGHNDVLAVACLVAAQSAIIQQKQALSILQLTLSGLGKVVGFALAPLFLRFVKPWTWVWMAAVTLVFVLPYREAGALAFRGLTQYGLRWRGNDSLFHLLFLATGSLSVAKTIVAVLLVTLVLILVQRRTTPLRGSYLTLGAILLLMTTVHPWYLIWIVPFLCIYTNPAWLFLTVSVGLSYHAAYLAVPGQPWEDVAWVKWLEYGPFFALAAFSAFRARKQLAGSEPSFTSYRCRRRSR